MTHPILYNFPFIELPKGSAAIKLLGLWFGILVFFFSPDLLHAKFSMALDFSSIHPITQNSYGSSHAKKSKFEPKKKECAWGSRQVDIIGS